MQNTKHVHIGPTVLENIGPTVSVEMKQKDVFLQNLV